MQNSSQGVARFCGSVERQLRGRNMSSASALDARRNGSIGLGKMGLPICERLAIKGFAVTALTRNPEGGSGPLAQTFIANPKLAVGSPAPISSFPPSATPPCSSASCSRLVDEEDAARASQTFVEISTRYQDASRHVAEPMSTIWGGTFDRPLSTPVRACIRSQPNHEGS